MSQHVIVIGAGVIGLQTAITLLEAKYTVTIIARHWPGDESTEYTSPWAGAIWRSHAAAGDVERCEWDMESYRVWMRVAEEEPEQAREMGIEKCPISIYSNDKPTHTPWYAQHVQAYTPISSPLSPTGHGHTFSSLAINPPTYLSYLHSRAAHLGATFITATLPAPLAAAIQTASALTSQASSDQNTPKHIPIPSIFINATGLSAPPLCPTDTSTHPIRGQTLLATMHPTPTRQILLWDNTTAHGDEITYILPRRGTSTFVLGGTKDAGNYDTLPTPRISEAIVARCKRLFAACGQGDVRIEVLAEQVGFRPGRTGGPRIEVERVDVGRGEKGSVVHCYGHAGGGFQSSIGCARKVLGLVRELEL
ncbi:nucleotide-binding domain-containing protein [Pyrenochaeta sp. DS3sAY3a]|nr:nucleotide-binding domain-containing protein [Pyrenochaeta sp. DS3sAY3a]